MELWLVILLFIIGLVLVAFGGDRFVDCSVVLAKKMKISPLLIGATIVSIGTTLPELLVSIISSAKGDTALAVSNGVGSMLCNLTLILGILLVAKTTSVNRKQLVPKMAIGLVNIILLTIFMADNVVKIWESIILLLLFIVFIWLNLHDAKKPKSLGLTPENGGEVKTEEEKKPQNIWWTVAFFIVSAAAIGVGANLLVENASIIAGDYLKIPKEIIGVTIVAIGTSLPELVTAIVSLKKNCLELSIGNIMGANIINGSLLVGLCGLIAGGSGGMVIGEGLTTLISAVLVLAGLLVVIIPMLQKSRTYKWQGALMLAIYVGYLIYVVVTTFA